MRNTTSILSAAIIAVTTLLFAPIPASGSDHADPMLQPLRDQEAGLTGLFAFREGDDLVLILNTRRGLRNDPPFELRPYEFTIFIDLDSAVTFTEGSADLARYGGTVVNPAGIEHDVAIRFRLDSSAQLQPGYPQIDGKLERAREATAGVYDDPFIFPRFFETNVISMAVSIPLDAFSVIEKDQPQNFLIWATTTKKGWFGKRKQLDHVGRSNRTQLGRLDFLNTLHPSEQVAVLEGKLNSGQRVEAGLMQAMSRLPSLGALSGLFEYVFQIRRYDVFPDVMIYTTRFPSGFPNGRRLEDDVAHLTCNHGDCVLQEVAFIEGGWPRKVENDRKFEKEFPYLAEAWPGSEEEKAHVHWQAPVMWLLLLGGLALLVYFLRWRARRAETPYVRG